MNLRFRSAAFAAAALIVTQGISASVTNEVQYLSGTDKDNTVPWQFRVSAGRKAGVWTTIPVPSCWDTKGFGSYEYGWDSTKEFGEYRTTFGVPAEWAGNKRVFLVFEGSMTDTEARINGLPAGGGVTSGPPADERAFDNRASAGMGQGGGVAVANGNLNLGTLSAVTLTCWVKPEADFATMPDGRFPRLMLLGANANYDGNAANGVYLSVYNSGSGVRTLQFKINSDAGSGALASAGILNGSDWTFVAVTFDPALGSGNVKFYVGGRSGALGAAVSTVTYGAGASAQLGANAFAYLLNRGGDRGRAFDGLGDDFRVFAGALDAAQLETVRASGLDVGVAAPAPLYQWSLNHASTGTGVAPAAGSGGTLTLQNSGGAAADLYSPIGDGVGTMTLADERAFDNRASAAMGQGGGVAVANGNLNLGTLSALTLTCWLKPEADFAAMPDGRFPRLMLLGANANYDGNAANGVYLSVYNSGSGVRTLQFKINSDAGSGALASAGILNGSDWTFVAVTFDPALGSGNVKFYVGGRSGALGAAVSTVTYGAGASAQLGANAFAYLLNRGGDRGRAFDGLGDDFRVFGGALDAAQLEAVRASGLGAGGTPPTPLYHWNFNHATTGTSVAPAAGSGGTLTPLNSGGAAADLYSPIGDGVSAGLSSSTGSLVTRGGFYEFSHEVTDNLNYGASNLLEVTVRKVSSNDSINGAERRADYWTFGGIYRPVYLEARPLTHIERVAVDAKADGRIAVHTFLSGVTGPLTVAARVADMDGVPLGSEFTQPVAAAASGVVLSASLPSPRQWSPEFPHLYRLTVEIRDGATVLHSHTETIGFRTIALVPGSGFTVNGKKVLMRGVNRHDFWPTDGRTTSRAVSIADIELMKDMNVNAVRMSHYPPAKHFLEECDRLGLLVFDELAGWQSAYDDTVAPDLVRRMVIRDVNHPSIFAWGNGNEGGFNRNVTSHYALWDPQGRTTLQAANWGAELTGNVRTHHYALYNVFSSYLGAGKPVYMPTEIQHALFDGGGGAGLADHWEPMRTAPNGGGMFIWAFADEGIARDDRGGAIDVANEAAPDGIVGPYREKEASYHTVKALWSPVQLTPPDPATFGGSLAVENRFDFTNLNQCAFSWQLGWFPDPADSSAVQDSGFIVGTSGGPFAGPSVAPGASGTLALGLPPGLSLYDALRVTARDPHGREIYTWTWPLHDAAWICDRLVKAAIPPAAALVPTVSGGELSVTNGARTWRFDLATGRLDGVSVAGQAVSISNGPRPVAGTWTTSSVTHGFDGADYLVTMNDVTSASDGFQWRLRPDGWLKLKYRYTLTGEQTWLGVTFDYPEANVTGMRWLGQGPYRVWKNRPEGQELGVHHKTVNDAIAGYRWSGFPEFRGYHGRLHWARLDTTQQPITVTTGTPDLFLRVLTPHLPPSNVTTRASVFPAFPAGDLSLLHAINPIGNKFESATATAIGPGSAPNTATGLYEGEAAFFFGAFSDPGADRDGNGLSDAWELQHFNTLGHDPADDPDGDGFSLLFENAFDLSPLAPVKNSPRLPHLVSPGSATPMALAYGVPLARLNEFRFLPEISGDLTEWFDAEMYPDDFRIESADLAGERLFSVQYGPDWAGGSDRVFLRLRIERK